MDFCESKTKENLAWAFASECQAGARYQFIATQAQVNKLVYLKYTMKNLAKNEMAHAKLFYDFIIDKCNGDCKVDYNANYPYVSLDFQEGLSAEQQIEQNEFERIYPQFAQIAREEGFLDVAKTFEMVAEVERTHSAILQEIDKRYKNNTLYKFDREVLMRCSNCGHTEFLKEGWKTCPLCSAEQGYIMLNLNDAVEFATKINENNK